MVVNSSRLGAVGRVALWILRLACFGFGFWALADASQLLWIDPIEGACGMWVLLPLTMLAAGLALCGVGLLTIPNRWVRAAGVVCLLPPVYLLGSLFLA